MPAIMFMKIYEAPTVDKSSVLLTLYGVSFGLSLALLGLIIGKVFRFRKSSNAAFINSISFYNAGNFGIPLMLLVFNDPYSISILIFIILGQNLLVYTLGAYNASFGSGDFISVVKKVFSLPMLYVLLISILFNKFAVQVPVPILSALDIISQGMVPLALFTLGAQLSGTAYNFNDKKIYLSNFIRLFAAPMIALLFIKIFNITGMIAQIMFISAGTPTAVDTALMAIEFKNEPNFASQVVFTSTILSMLTMTVIIYLSKIIF
jgi:predicted permease